MNTTPTNSGSAHVCDQCGASFKYPAEYRPYGLPGDKDDGGCCPCSDCEPDLFRDCIAQSIEDGDLAPDYTYTTEAR